MSKGVPLFCETGCGAFMGHGPPKLKLKCHQCMVREPWWARHIGQPTLQDFDRPEWQRELDREYAPFQNEVAQ